ncbi:hypothetical protein BAE44_0009699 [Dichanthelium oligosanthes]|uniref:VAN3-binding protein-like auxin canalisation domain-containing protein n=1 Tax=Dichanthelium oligosanthes TaxID=888268 RepID=A0A1E5VW00_9POAL|nr:hypothetical protein BAE44_0009699 [Dichanthelium oligosanthes]
MFKQEEIKPIDAQKAAILRCREKSRRSTSSYHSAEMPAMPEQAMEFLSRTWSPSSSDLFEILSPACSQLNAGNMKAILRGFLLSTLSVTGSQRRRARDELRLHSAQAHAAVSVAQLAAAVAGMVSVCELRQQPAGRGGGDRRMGAVLASAAALVAIVCAEAAETSGANRVRVASAVRAARESRSPAELLALTATAATSLRGAATLKTRAADVRGIGDGNSAVSIRASIQKGTILRVCLPCDEVLAVSGGGGSDEAVVDGRRLFPLALSTAGGGTVQLLLEHQAHCKVWTASVQGMLSEQKLKHPIN